MLSWDGGQKVEAPHQQALWQLYPETKCHSECHSYTPLVSHRQLPEEMKYQFIKGKNNI